MNTFVVIGLGHGDEGKGSIVDYLTRKHDSKLTIRFNGGPQAAHHVVLEDGTWHCFSQFGSGTLAGAETFLQREMYIDPILMLREAKVLETALNGPSWDPTGRSASLRVLGKKGVRAMKTILIDPGCSIVTPYHRMICRMKETAADEKRSSTGLGVGEAVDDPMKIRLIDTLDPEFPQHIEAHIRDRMKQASEIDHPEAQSFRTFTSETYPAESLARIYVDFARQNRDRIMTTHEILPRFENETIIFEGAQGALLDRRTGNAPFITRTDCSPATAHAICNEFQRDPEVIGVMRAYAHRHGNGPLPTEHQLPLGEVHNIEEQWQGPFRTGWLDLHATRTALEITGPIDSIALTHVDRIEGLRDLQYSRIYNEGLPELEPIAHNEITEIITTELGIPVTITSRGPTAAEKS